MANLIFAEGFKLIYKWSKRWQRVLFAERINTDQKRTTNKI